MRIRTYLGRSSSGVGESFVGQSEVEDLERLFVCDRCCPGIVVPTGQVELTSFAQGASATVAEELELEHPSVLFRSIRWLSL